MARNNMLPMKTGGGLLGKVIGAVVLLAVLSLVIKHPADAAGWITGVWHVGSRVVDGLSTFLQTLFG